MNVILFVTKLAIFEVVDLVTFPGSSHRLGPSLGDSSAPSTLSGYNGETSPAMCTVDAAPDFSSSPQGHVKDAWFPAGF